MKAMRKEFSNEELLKLSSGSDGKARARRHTRKNLLYETREPLRP